MTVALMSHSANMPGYKHTSDLDEVSRYCFLASSHCTTTIMLVEIMFFLSVSIVLQTPGSPETPKDKSGHNGTLTNGPVLSPGELPMDIRRHALAGHCQSKIES